jgi:hypothetical protein
VDYTPRHTNDYIWHFKKPNRASSRMGKVGKEKCRRKRYDPERENKLRKGK